MLDSFYKEFYNKMSITDAIQDIVLTIVSDIKKKYDYKLEPLSNSDYRLEIQKYLDKESTQKIQNYEMLECLMKRFTPEFLNDIRIRLKPDISSESCLRYVLIDEMNFTEDEFKKAWDVYISDEEYMSWKEAFFIQNERAQKYIAKIKELENKESFGEKFTRDNITENSILNAKCKIVNNRKGYNKSYKTFDDLLNSENISLEPTITGGLKGLPKILKAKLNPDYKTVFIAIDGYRIDFYFED